MSPARGEREAASHDASGLGLPEGAASHRQRPAELLLAWLNRRFARGGRPIEGGTPLFEDGLIDSIRILEIIAWVEWAAGRRIEDREIRMDYFRTVDRIAELFFSDVGGSDAAR